MPNVIQKGFRTLKFLYICPHFVSRTSFLGLVNCSIPGVLIRINTVCLKGENSLCRNMPGGLEPNVIFSDSGEHLVSDIIPEFILVRNQNIFGNRQLIDAWAQLFKTNDFVS